MSVDDVVELDESNLPIRRRVRCRWVGCPAEETELVVLYDAGTMVPEEYIYLCRAHSFEFVRLVGER